MAFFGSEQVADFSDGFPKGVDGPDSSGAQNSLELGEGHLDRIEVGAIGRQEKHPRALGEFALAEQIRQILVDEQDHQIDLATALGEDVPDLTGPRK